MPWILSAFLVLMGLAIGGTVTDSKYKKPAGDELQKILTPQQFEVTQKCGTEPPFKNEYWDNKRDGIYVDIVSGEPLFSSLDKFDSGSGWPSFTKPISTGHLTEKDDTTLPFQKRTEVRSKKADSHLGHVFNDGPGPNGLRYCINSASLRFVPVEKLAQNGYSEFLPLFKNAQKKQTATLAGGCFWGMEEIIRQIPGILETKVGYTGGDRETPQYEEVKTGKTGHAEAIEIVFDPSKISFEQLLGYFFRMHDPTTLNRQGNDIGTQYRSAVFYHDDEQKKVAEKVKAQIEKSGKWKKPLVTQIVPAKTFFRAEEYHQKYLVKNPGGYTCHFLRD